MIFYSRLIVTNTQIFIGTDLLKQESYVHWFPQTKSCNPFFF